VAGDAAWRSGVELQFNIASAYTESEREILDHAKMIHQCIYWTHYQLYVGRVHTV